MDSCGRVLITVAAIFSCLFLHFPAQTEANGLHALRAPAELTKLLDSVCRQGNANFRFCVRSLISDPRTLSVHGVKGVANVALDRARKESVKVAAFFDGLTMCKTTNPAFQPALQQFSQSFKDLVGYLNLSGLEGETASLDVHYAQDAADGCVSALAASKVQIPAVAAKIHQWRNFYQTAYAAVLGCENEAEDGKN